MIYKTWITAVLFLSVSLAHGETSDQLCMAGGFYAGAQDEFLTGLASHILNKRNKLMSPECTALWGDAVGVGKHFTKTGKFRPSDQQALSAASNFKQKVYDAITQISGFDK